MKRCIKYVTRIQVTKDTAEPELLAIRASGLADNIQAPVPVLVPRKYTSTPSDGVYELDFKLDEDQESGIDIELEIQVVIRVKDIPEWAKAIRINAEKNSDVELI